MKKLMVGGIGLGLALCLPCLGVVYTDGECSAANLLHRWSFNGDLSDSVGGRTGSAVGQISFLDGNVSLPGGASGTGYVDLGPGTLPTSGACTIEIFATQRGIWNWSRVFSVGKNPAAGNEPANWDFIYHSWTWEKNIERDEVRLCSGTIPAAAFQIDDKLAPYTLDVEWHIVMVFEPQPDDTMKITSIKESRDGTVRRSIVNVTGAPWSITLIDPESFYLGHSRWANDSDAQADYNEVRVWNAALTETQLAWSARLGADTLPTAAAAGAETATISVATEIGGKVSIDSAPAFATGSTTVPKNQLVTLTAVPDTDFHFSSWTGDLSAIQNGGARDATITVYAAYAASFTATFRQDAPPTWTGEGTTSLWSEAANWLEELTPVQHAKVIFDGSLNTTNENNLVTALDSMTFGENAAAHWISGYDVALGLLENYSSATQTVDFAVFSADADPLPIVNPGNLVFNKAVTAPTLNVTGSGTTIFNEQAALAVENLDPGATVIFKGGVNAGENEHVLNGGTTYLNGTSHAQSIHLQEDNTTLTFAGADTVFTATYDLCGGWLMPPGQTTTININGATLNLGRNLLTETSDGTGGGTTREGGNGVINQTGGSVTLSDYLIIGRDHEGTYNLVDGTLAQTADNKDYVFIGEIGGSYGVFNVSGNSRFTCGLNFQIGRYGTGVMNVAGGEVLVPAWLSIGRMATGDGTLNITGGRVVQTRSDCGFIIGEYGKATVNVSGEGVLDTTGPVSFAHNSADVQGELNLTDGGTLLTTGIIDRNLQSASLMYVDGGKIVAKGSGATLDNFCALPNVMVGPKGMTLDTGDNRVNIYQPMISGGTEGAITKVGSGTLCMSGGAVANVKVQEGTFGIAGDSEDGWRRGDPAAATAPHLIHRWSFNGDLTDSVGDMDATGIGTEFADNAIRTTGGGKSASYVSLNPDALPKDRPFTLEIFATPKAIHSWSRIFSFGKGEPNSDHKENFFMSWTRATNVAQDQVRFRYGSNGDNALSLDETMQPFTVGTKWHIALCYVPNVTPDGKGRFYWCKSDLNGNSHRDASAITAMPVDLAAWGMDGFYLGRSYWSVDLDASADYDEVRIWDAALTPEQLRMNARLGPDVLPQPAKSAEEATLLHRWSFNGDAQDSIGGTTATRAGTTAWNDPDHPTAITIPGGANGTGYVNLGVGMLPAEGGPVTLEIWATQHSVQKWGRIFDIGFNNQNYLTLAWNADTSTTNDRLEIKKNNGALITSDAKLFGYEPGIEYHISVTVEPMADGRSFLRWMRRNARSGAIIKEACGFTSAAWSVGDIAGGLFFLGHSQYGGDLDANASYNEVRVWKGVLSDAQLARSVRLGPDALPGAEPARESVLELTAGTSIDTLGNRGSLAKLTGVGTIKGSGELTITDTLDIAGDEIGEMALDGNLVITGTWLLDTGARGACDKLAGTGTLDISNATIDVRDVSKLHGVCVLAEVGEVTGFRSAKLNVKGRKLFCSGGLLTLSTDGLFFFLR